MTDQITQLLDDVQRLDEQATQGPWEYEDYFSQVYGEVKREGNSVVHQTDIAEGLQNDADGHLIALSRTAMPAMGKALRAVLELLSAAEEDPSNKLSFMYDGAPFPATVTTNEVRQAITDALEADGVV